MFSKAIVSSVLLAALANGLAIRRDTSTPPVSVSPLPTVTPSVLLPDPSVTPSILLPDPSVTPSVLLPDPSVSLSLPDPSISVSLPPIDQSSSAGPAATPPPSVVTTTVYVYPSQCSPTLSGSSESPLPTVGPSSVPSSVPPPQDGSLTLPPPAQPSSIALPDPQVSPLNLPKVRRGDSDSVISQLRALQQEVINTWVDKGKGDIMMSVVGQLESLIAQAAVPGANGAALLKQAQSLVNN